MSARIRLTPRGELVLGSLAGAAYILGMVAAVIIIATGLGIA